MQLTIDLGHGTSEAELCKAVEVLAFFIQQKSSGMTTAVIEELSGPHHAVQEAPSYEPGLPGAAEEFPDSNGDALVESSQQLAPGPHTTHQIAAATETNPTGAVNVDGPDSEGVLWDARIHQASKKKKADGTYCLRKRTTKLCEALAIADTDEAWHAYVGMVKGELKGEPVVTPPIPEGNPPITTASQEPSEPSVVQHFGESTQEVAAPSFGYADLMEAICRPEVAPHVGPALASLGVASLPALAAQPDKCIEVGRMLGLIQ